MNLSNAELTQEMKDAIDDMLRRRMENTGETEQESREFLANYFRERAEWLRSIGK